MSAEAMIMMCMCVCARAHAQRLWNSHSYAIQSNMQNRDTVSSSGYIKHYEVYNFWVDTTKFCEILMPCEL